MEKVLIFTGTRKKGDAVAFHTIILYLALTVFSLVVFFPTFSNGFQLAWDDTWQVIENPLIQNYSIVSVFSHFIQYWQGQYSPVNSLLYLGIFWLYGMDAGAFHVTCLLLHLVCSYLVLSISRSVFSKLLPSVSQRDKSVYAFFTAIAFAIHPVQVESVAWISASKILLYGFFTLLALCTYIRYLGAKRRIWLFLTAFIYILCFGSKEQGILLPLNLLLMDWIWGRFTLNEETKKFPYRVLWEKIPFLILCLAFYYFTWVNGGSPGSSSAYPVPQRLVFSAYSLVEYVFRFLAPVKLYFFHPYPISPGEPLPLYFFGYFLLASLIAYFVWEQTRKGNRLILFGFYFFLFNLLLVLHFIPLPRPVITADRYVYLSVIGLTWMLIGLANDWRGIGNRKIKTSFLLYGGLIWLVLLSFQSHLRTGEWKDSDTTKSNVLELMEKNSESEDSEPFFNLVKP